MKSNAVFTVSWLLIIVCRDFFSRRKALREKCCINSNIKNNKLFQNLSDCWHGNIRVITVFLFGTVYGSDSAASFQKKAPGLQSIRRFWKISESKKRYSLLQRLSDKSHKIRYTNP